MTCTKSLRAAAAKGDVRCLRELLRRGEDPNTQDEHGETPLHYVALSCEFIGEPLCVNAAKVLLDYGADPNARDEWGVTPLHQAASGGHTELVKLLLDRGADPNAIDNFGVTPLHAAAAKGHADVAKLFA